MQARTRTIPRFDSGNGSGVLEIVVAKEVEPCWRSPLCLHTRKATEVVMAEWWRMGYWSSLDMR